MCHATWNNDNDGSTTATALGTTRVQRTTMNDGDGLLSSALLRSPPGEPSGRPKLSAEEMLPPFKALMTSASPPHQRRAALPPTQTTSTSPPAQAVPPAPAFCFVADGCWPP